MRPSSLKTSTPMTDKPPLINPITQKLSQMKIDPKAFSIASRKPTIPNKLLEKEQFMIETNILKINKENINKTFVKVSKANNMGRMLKPKINFKATANQNEEIQIKMYLGGNFLKQFDGREFEAESTNQVQKSQETLSRKSKCANLGCFQIQGR